MKRHRKREKTCKQRNEATESLGERYNNTKKYLMRIVQNRKIIGGRWISNKIEA